jgi:branched-chain amino acid transport system ATP-binding protein
MELAACPHGGHAMTAVLETRALDKHFGGLHVTRGVSLQLNAGDRLALIGPNGAGKTTFVNLVSGVLAPSAGQVLLAGQDVTQRTRSRSRRWQRTCRCSDRSSSRCSNAKA